MIYIYKHRNNINGKVYIGQTNDIKNRWYPSSYKQSTMFYRAIQKYGWDNFTHEILSEIEDQNEADNQEIALIKYFDSTNPEKGYNILLGGATGFKGISHSEESKKKISESLKGKMSGNKNPMYGKKAAATPMYGKHHSEETKKKISESQKKSIYLIDTIDGWDEYYPSVKDLHNNYPEWNYSSLKDAANKNRLFKKRYKIEYAEEV